VQNWLSTEQCRSITNSVASAIFRSGTGSIGQISGSVSSGVITLANSADVVQFEVNMVLQANATDGGTPRAALGYVIAVNRSVVLLRYQLQWAERLHLLLDGQLTTIFWFKVIITLKPLVLQRGCLQLHQLRAIFSLGVNRSVDTWRLGGGRYDGSAQSIEEALIDASSSLAREGGKPDVAITNFASYSALEKALGSKIQYVDMKGPADIAFRGIMINGANSVIKVFPDRNAQASRAYLLQMDTWALEGLGDVPQILRYGDGLEMLRVYNADAGEVRVGAYYQLRTNAPGWNCNVTLSA